MTFHSHVYALPAIPKTPLVHLSDDHKMNRKAGRKLVEVQDIEGRKLGLDCSQKLTQRLTKVCHASSNDCWAGRLGLWVSNLPKRVGWSPSRFSVLVAGFTSLVTRGLAGVVWELSGWVGVVRWEVGRCEISVRAIPIRVKRLGHHCMHWRQATSDAESTHGVLVQVAHPRIILSLIVDYDQSNGIILNICDNALQSHSKQVCNWTLAIRIACNCNGR
jgi:hypothetical protein